MCIWGAADAQNAAKKPKVMVVPSDDLLLQMGLLSATDDMGEVNYVQHYREAFLNTDVKAVISKFGEMMADRGFPTVMLEQELKRVQGKGGLQIPVDIKVELSFKMETQGPRKRLFFSLGGVDSYSSKQIAAASGSSAPAIGATAVELLQEAVLNHIDKFNSQLMDYFNSLTEIGRESRLTIESNSVNLDSMFEIVEAWLETNCVRGAFTVDQQEENYIMVSQAMMPLFGPSNRALDAYSFYKPLKQELLSKGFTCKLKRKGLGEVALIVK